MLGDNVNVYLCVPQSDTSGAVNLLVAVDDPYDFGLISRVVWSEKKPFVTIPCAPPDRVLDLVTDSVKYARKSAVIAAPADRGA